MAQKEENLFFEPKNLSCFRSQQACTRRCQNQVVTLLLPECVIGCAFLLGHELAGLSPGHPSDRARMGQVNKGEVNRRWLFIGGVVDHHCRTPARGGIPHLK